MASTDYALASPLDVDDDGAFTISSLQRGPRLSAFERYADKVREYIVPLWTATSVIAFVGFIIACCAMGKANAGPGSHGRGPMDHWENRCQILGTSLYGDDVFSWEKHHYQVVGGHWAKMTWRGAEQDAWSRCYKGKAGRLAMINSETENEMLMARMYSHHGFTSSDAAWIGGADLEVEGQFQWIGDSGSLAGDVFYKNGGPVHGQYSNFRAGEPNNNGEEDCVKMDADGQWNDESCYQQLQYFFIEFEK